MSENKNKNGIVILILLLLLVAAAVFYFFYSKKQGIDLPSSIQGSSTISEGEIKLKIWDNNTEDGDSVKVYLDDKLLRDTLPLLYEPWQLNFGRLSKGEHLLTVAAINEGMTAPASATMGISNGTEIIEFEMNATMDSAAAWKIFIK